MKHLSIFFGAAASALMLTAGTACAQKSESQQNGKSGNMPQQQQVDLDVDNQELQNFAKAFQEVKTLQKEARKEMVNVLEEQNLTIEEYNQFFRHQQKDDSPSEDVSEKQLKRLKAADTEIDKLNQKLQSDIEEAITNQGLEMERFQKIRMGVMQDQKLQQTLKEMMQK